LVLRFEGISKVFRSSLTRRHVYKLGPVSFGVEEGEIFGYLGPNGAGKTTTIKIALGLLRPSAGQVTCFGKPSASTEVRGRIGFLPEHPYFYQHLTACELLEFYGQVCGLRTGEVGPRAIELLRMVGLADFGEAQISSFSKGMLQRIGMAQALINDPDLVILDEPLAGLDPVGRREIRDVILGLKARGKTVFFSSHILQDAEMICDRVGILSRGRMLKVASVANALQESIRCVEILLDGLDRGTIKKLGLSDVSESGDRIVVRLGPDADVNRAISDLIASGAKIFAVIPQRQTLEDYFMKEVESPGSQSQGGASESRNTYQRTG
jgi:ABC-2 type transport system ATP-binding protein